MVIIILKGSKPDSFAYPDLLLNINNPRSTVTAQVRSSSFAKKPIWQTKCVQQGNKIAAPCICAIFMIALFYYITYVGIQPSITFLDDTIVL